MKEKMKQKWGLETDWQFWAVIIVFSISGSSSLFVRKFLFGQLGISLDTMSLPVFILLYILIMVPSYYALTLIYGFIFGQFDFFLAFAKKSFGRFLPSKKTGK